MNKVLRTLTSKVPALGWAVLLLTTAYFVVSQLQQGFPAVTLLEGDNEPETLTFTVEITLYRENGLDSGQASVSVFMTRQGESWRASYTILSSNLDRRVIEGVLRGVFNYEMLGSEEAMPSGSIVYVSEGGTIYKCSLENLTAFRVETSIVLGGLTIKAQGVIAAPENGSIPLYIEVSGTDPRTGYTLEAVAVLTASTLPLCGEPLPQELFNLLGGVSLAIALLALFSVFWRHRTFREIEASYYYI